MIFKWFKTFVMQLHEGLHYLTAHREAGFSSLVHGSVHILTTAKYPFTLVVRVWSKYHRFSFGGWGNYLGFLGPHKWRMMSTKAKKASSLSVSVPSLTELFPPEWNKPFHDHRLHFQILISQTGPWAPGRTVNRVQLTQLKLNCKKQFKSNLYLPCW